MQFTVYSVSYTSPQLQTEGGGIPWAEGASQAPEEGGQPYRTVQGYWCTWCTEYSSTITHPWPDYTWARGKGGRGGGMFGGMTQSTAKVINPSDINNRLHLQSLVLKLWLFSSSIRTSPACQIVCKEYQFSDICLDRASLLCLPPPTPLRFRKHD